jgi:hypothetical protein
MPGIPRTGTLAKSNAIAAANGVRGRGATTTQTNATPNANNAPQKAPAAPKGNTKEVFTGLAEALNTHQQKLVKDNKYQLADIYEFEFAEEIGAAKLKKPGATNKKAVALQDSKTAKLQKDPNTNSLNTNSRSRPVSAGMQIVQFIDETIRGSSYITDQQLFIYNEVPNPKTGEQELIPNPNAQGKQVAWFKINVACTTLGYDSERRDYAYKMKFVVTPYAISSVPSEYFSTSRYRGSHKKYSYWFTGQNTQILDFQQTFNNSFRLALTGTPGTTSEQKIGGNKLPKTDFREQYRRTYMATSENHAKGAEGYTNEPADNLAESLYNPNDFSTIKLKIVGDPAWLQQGEISDGVSARTFNYRPFNADGGINYDSQEIIFDVSWNRPADYNFDTGIMEVTSKNTKNNEPQDNYTYKAMAVKSTFSKGRFEQELTGQAFVEYEKNPQTTAAAAARPIAGPDAPQDEKTFGTSRSNTTTANTNNNWQTEVNRTQGENLETVTNTNETDSALQPQPAPPPKPPTSSGDIITDSTKSSDVLIAVNNAPQVLPSDPTLVVYGGSLNTPSQKRLAEGEVRVYGENSTPQNMDREA